MMRTRAALLFLAFAAGCAGGKSDPGDDFTSLRGVDEKSDQFSLRMKIVGEIAWGASSGPIAYANPPRYRALTFRAHGGDRVDAWVRSGDGDAIAWLLDGNFAIVAHDDDADGSTTDSHLQAVLPAQMGDVYYIVFREYGLAQAAFAVSLDGARKPKCDTAVTCEDVGAECGAISDGCGGMQDCEGCAMGQVCSADHRCGGVDGGQPINSDGGWLPSPDAWPLVSTDGGWLPNPDAWQPVGADGGWQPNPDAWPPVSADGGV